jgi:hypothetical protein
MAPALFVLSASWKAAVVDSNADRLADAAASATDGGLGPAQPASAAKPTAAIRKDLDAVPEPEMFTCVLW